LNSRPLDPQADFHRVGLCLTVPVAALAERELAAIGARL